MSNINIRDHNMAKVTLSLIWRVLMIRGKCSVNSVSLRDLRVVTHRNELFITE